MGGQKEVCKKIDLDKPRYDQETYWGRAIHFFQTTNPTNLLYSNSSLERAKCIVLKHRCGQHIPEDVTEDELWKAKRLYDSAFHPQTGEKMNLIGRMSAQVPMNMLLLGGMMTYYRTFPAVAFWQWVNQSFNALVNYTNRSGDLAVNDKQLLYSYLFATGGAVATAIGLNSIVKCSTPPVLRRLIPFAAVAAANCINIPMMRSQELKDGTPVYDDRGRKLGYSKEAAKSGVSQVVLSRVLMAAPGMALTPFVMNHYERKGVFCRRPWLALPLQIGLLGFCLVFATPLACAVFKQNAEMRFSQLEEELRDQLNKRFNCRPPQIVYYNKGL